MMNTNSNTMNEQHEHGSSIFLPPFDSRTSSTTSSFSFQQHNFQPQLINPNNDSYPRPSNASNAAIMMNHYQHNSTVFPSTLNNNACMSYTSNLFPQDRHQLLNSQSNLTMIPNNFYVSPLPSTSSFSQDPHNMGMNNFYVSPLPSTSSFSQDPHNMGMNNFYVSPLPSTSSFSQDPHNMGMNNFYVSPLPSTSLSSQDPHNLGMNNIYVSPLPSTSSFSQDPHNLGKIYDDMLTNREKQYSKPFLKDRRMARIQHEVDQALREVPHFSSSKFKKMSSAVKIPKFSRPPRPSMTNYTPRTSQQQQHIKVIHLRPPPVIHVEKKDFKKVVQNLTGWDKSSKNEANPSEEVLNISDDDDDDEERNEDNNADHA
ncbi:hypothetical protein BVRB_015030 [Beta vulgaris subsp. vulgaris]|uniref:VQ domain-containing protein n=1 Tax=Beta vulgaris subsp. vulgaris TaxID=3555 RepID=A0A0J8B1C9_BETVV|nr:hypothetical protein BVRB_015030 [Beta vulgaris subsp. vulgaris]